MSGCRIFLHPALLQRFPAGDIVRSFASRGYVLSNVRCGIEARPVPTLTNVVPIRGVNPFGTSRVDAIFEFARRPQ